MDDRFFCEMRNPWVQHVGPAGDDSNSGAMRDSHVHPAQFAVSTLTQALSNLAAVLLTGSSVSGYTIGESVTQSGGGSGRVVWFNDTSLYVMNVSGSFNTSAAVVGAESSASFTPTATDTGYYGWPNGMATVLVWPGTCTWSTSIPVLDNSRRYRLIGYEPQSMWHRTTAKAGSIAGGVVSEIKVNAVAAPFFKIDPTYDGKRPMVELHNLKINTFASFDYGLLYYDSGGDEGY